MRIIVILVFLYSSTPQQKAEMTKEATKISISEDKQCIHEIAFRHYTEKIARGKKKEIIIGRRKTNEEKIRIIAIIEYSIHTKPSCR